MQCGVAVVWGCGWWCGVAGGGVVMRFLVRRWCGNEVVWWYGIGENRMMRMVRWCGVAVVGAGMVYLIN